MTHLVFFKFRKLLIKFIQLELNINDNFNSAVTIGSWVLSLSPPTQIVLASQTVYAL